MFRTVHSVLPGGRTGRTAGGSPSYEPMDGPEWMEVRPDSLRGPAGPCGAFLLHLFGRYTQKLQVHDLISLIVCDYASHVQYAQTNNQGRIHL